jgi:hypothetical protein
MQNIDHMKWFRHVLNNIGGTPPVVQCVIVSLNNTIQLKISFDIPVRGPFHSSMSSEPPTLMLSIVEWGSPSPFKRTYESTAIQKCLEQFGANGYFILDYSYFLIKALEEGESVTMIAERLCRLNRNDMVQSIEM